jgi:hypothetical protein
MTATLIIPVNDATAEPCGGDCAYLDGACRCRHGEPTPVRFAIPELNDLVPPF